VLLCGGIFVLEAFSVILQVGYFKLTHGKRLFKMSPIHHHFEKCGWSEVKIVSVFSVATALFSLLALLGCGIF
ncbi:MAG: phospho-N-acetylmuramoyl-pentapeptide-transferase, partial [Clostridia bacterium]|nr:phospho-N-acetylmuramoyl-pentapeptide-transferase [Clostridia bacterium]